MAARKNITWKKRKSGSNNIFSAILLLLRRKSSEKEGKGTEILRKKNQDLKEKGDGEKLQVLGNFYTPALKLTDLLKKEKTREQIHKN